MKKTTYIRTLLFARPFSNIIPGYIIYTLLSIIFNITSFSFIMPILQVLFEKAKTKIEVVILPDFEFSVDYFKQFLHYTQYYLTAQSDHKTVLARICIILMVSIFLSNFFNYLSLRFLGLIRARVVRNMREKVYEKIISLPIGFFTNEKKGNILSRVTNDVQEVENAVISSFNIWFKDPITILILFSLLFYISVNLTIFTIIVLPVSGFVIGEITKRLKRVSVKGQASLGKILEIIDETLVGLRIIKAFNAEKYIKGKFNEHNQSYYNDVWAMENKKRLASPVSQVLGVGVVAGTIYYGGVLVLSNDASLKIKPDEFFYYILLLAQILAPLKSIANALSTIQRGLASGDRVFELMDTVNEIKDKPTATRIEEFKHGITFENLRFKYQVDDVLKGINLTFEKGKTIALVGPSGGGKSTMIDLIPRFYDPTAGSVKIDGIDVRDLEVHSVRNLMGVVTQESILFNDTIASNIAFGIDATQEQIEQAAKAANAHEFILGTEQGYGTEIGDRGLKLSGGQRQRLTIARAILKNPPILLLDEATSALDSESEHLVQEALNTLMKNRTSIVIAHRLSTIQNADLIVVIKDGQIAEQGTHQTLLAENGLYSKLSEMQSA